MPILSGIALVVEDLQQNGQKLAFRYPGPHGVEEADEGLPTGPEPVPAQAADTPGPTPPPSSDNAGVSAEQPPAQAPEPPVVMAMNGQVDGAPATSEPLPMSPADAKALAAARLAESSVVRVSPFLHRPGKERAKPGHVARHTQGPSLPAPRRRFTNAQDFWRFEPDLFAKMFRPTQAQCGRMFELSIDHLYFLSFPVKIRNKPTPADTANSGTGVPAAEVPPGAPGIANPGDSRPRLTRRESGSTLKDSSSTTILAGQPVANAAGANTTGTAEAAAPAASTAEAEDKHAHQELTMFSLIFILDTQCARFLEQSRYKLGVSPDTRTYGIPYPGSKEALDMFRRAAMRLAAGLLHEEHQCGYISEQVHIMLSSNQGEGAKPTRNGAHASDASAPGMQVQDSVEHDGDLKHHKLHGQNGGLSKERRRQSIMEVAQLTIEATLDRSQLARELRDVYLGLLENGAVDIMINNRVRLCFTLQNPCMHPTQPLRPYQALLLYNQYLEEPAVTPPDVSSQLSRVVAYARHHGPRKSFVDMASALSMPIEEVFKLVAHLVYWRKGRVVEVIRSYNVYRVAPSAELDPISPLHFEFHLRFGRRIQQELEQPAAIAQVHARHISASDDTDDSDSMSGTGSNASSELIGGDAGDTEVEGESLTGFALDGNKVTETAGEEPSLDDFEADSIGAAPGRNHGGYTDETLSSENEDDQDLSDEDRSYQENDGYLDGGSTEDGNSDSATSSRRWPKRRSARRARDKYNLDPNLSEGGSEDGGSWGLMTPPPEGDDGNRPPTRPSREKEKAIVTLSKVLELFSMAKAGNKLKTLREHADYARRWFGMEATEFYDVLDWLLCHELLIQMHRFFYLLVPASSPTESKYVNPGDTRPVGHSSVSARADAAARAQAVSNRVTAETQAAEAQAQHAAQSTQSTQAKHAELTALSNPQKRGGFFDLVSAEADDDADDCAFAARRHLYTPSPSGPLPPPDAERNDRNEAAYLEQTADSSFWYSLLRRLTPYLHGRHHAEEIIWREGITHEHLDKLVSVYSDVIFPFYHC